jgi:CheY-like chemotaxis protein/anti-sigma regulatory factor (Ser/Thr protein kinase)
VSARDKGLALAVEVAPDVAPQRHGDAVKLRQILINLLSNALKFTREGHVRLQVSRADDEAVLFRVEDSGPGIEAEDLRHLGVAFVQAEAGRRAAEGTGLGLAISSAYARLMGGTLELQSEVGVGTVAQLRVPLPIVQEASSEAAKPAMRMPVSLAEGQAPLRVLVVDDAEHGRRLLVRLLQPLGFDVREAADGLQAVEQWRHWRPQLILMDIRMPVMDGLQATRAIVSEAQGAARPFIVALTASTFEEERAGILAAGCDEYLRKPFRDEALFAILADKLGVRFVTAEDVPASNATPHEIAELPAPLREQLADALRRLDVRAVERAFEAVRGHDPALAGLIAPMVRSFEYEALAGLLRSAADR